MTQIGVIMACALSLTPLGIARASDEDRANKQAILAQATARHDSQDAKPMKIELGMLEREYRALNQDRERWLASFCSTILPLTGEEYERFVRLVREEAVFRGEVNSKQPRYGMHSFEEFTSNETKKQAFECLVHAGDSASAQTQFDLYLIARSTRQRPPINPYVWLRKAAEGSHPMAQYLMAENLLTGASSPRVSEVIPAAEKERADSFHSYLQSAAKSGVPQAQNLLGSLYLGRTRWGAAFKDIAQGIEWLKRAASQSQHLPARYQAARLLGNAYFDGEVVPRDYAEALRWYTVIPREEMNRLHAPHAPVAYRLRQMYCEGLGVERDPEKAKSYSPAGIGCP